jgi:hypothetical protein
MTIWAWVGMGGVALTLTSTLVSLALAAILAEIAGDASELLDEESWLVAPLTARPSR